MGKTHCGKKVVRLVKKVSTNELSDQLNYRMAGGLVVQVEVITVKRKMIGLSLRGNGANICIFFAFLYLVTVSLYEIKTREFLIRQKIRRQRRRKS